MSEYRVEKWYQQSAREMADLKGQLARWETDGGKVER